MAQKISYKDIALQWQPEENADPIYKTLLCSLIGAFILVGIYISTINIPEKSRQEKNRVPERVARFVSQNSKKIDPPKPAIKPIKDNNPVKISLPENTVSRQKPLSSEKIMSQKQESARIRASKIGLVALSNELNSMIDTSTIDQNVRASLQKSSSNLQSSHEVDIISTKIKPSENKIEKNNIIANIEERSISERSTQSLTLAAQNMDNEKETYSGGTNTGRSVSDIGFVFNKNKSTLHSLYERERRKNSSLKGKIVFQLTISPAGKVIGIKVISSELSSSELESRLLARVKLFVFSPTNDEAPIIINYPVEFVPS